MRRDIGSPGTGQARSGRRAAGQRQAGEICIARGAAGEQSRGGDRADIWI